MSVIDLGIEHLTDGVIIGRGGFATVYAATDTRFARKVAVKVLNDGMEADNRRRFDKECETMGRLSGHPNVVTVYTGGFTRAGSPYLIMELVDGGTLADRLVASGPIPWKEAVDFVMPVADALSAAHRAGILHRDLKPGNILLDGDTPKLADFGISRLLDGVASTSTHVAASWLHTAPETFKNQRDERSDLYSLASTLQTLITGHAPFWQPEDDSLNPALFRLLHEDPPPLDPPLAPAGLGRFLLLALSKDPGERPASAAEFARQLRAATKLPAARPGGPAPDDGPGDAMVPEVAVVAASSGDPAGDPAGSAGDLLLSGADEPGDQQIGLSAAGTRHEPRGRRPPSTVPAEVAPVVVQPRPAEASYQGSGQTVDRMIEVLTAPVEWSRRRSPVELTIAAGIVLSVLLAIGALLPLGGGGSSATSSATTEGTETSAGGDAGGADSEVASSTSGAEDGGEAQGGGESESQGEVQDESESQGESEAQGGGEGEGEGEGQGQDEGERAVVLRGHGAIVRAVFALDEGRIASADENGIIMVWSPPDLEPVVLAEHSGSVWALAALPEGRLASAGADGTIRIWHVGKDGAEAAEPEVLRGHSGDVLSLAVLPDGRLASGGEDGTVWIWEPDGPAAGAPAYRGHDEAVHGVVGLPDGRVVSGSDDGEIHLWDPADAVAATGSSGPSESIRSLALLPDGRIAAGSSDGTVSMRNPDSLDGQEATFTHHVGIVAAVVALPDGRVASASSDGTVLIWDPRDLSLEPIPFAEHSGAVRDLAVLVDGSVASASGDRTVRLWKPPA